MYRITGGLGDLNIDCGCGVIVPIGSTCPTLRADCGLTDPVCTCVNGVCTETGNSCGSPDAGPVGSAAYIAQQNALIAAALKQQSSSGPFSFTNWLNAHSDLMLIGGAGLVGLLFLSSPGGLLGGRR